MRSYLLCQQVFECFQGKSMSSFSILQLTEKPIVEFFSITPDGSCDRCQTIPKFIRLMLSEMEFFRRGIDGENTG